MTDNNWEKKEYVKKTHHRIDGRISAAILSSGIGCVVIGLMTTGAVISETLESLLSWSTPVGPLSGKTGIGIIFLLLSWVIFHNVFKNHETSLEKIMTITLVLIGFGLLLTFPPVFEAFE